MSFRLTVPQLDANTLDVTVTAWRKALGDPVAVGEVVAELTTDKATFEYESTGSGTLLAIFASPKSVVPAGYILALLGQPGEVDSEATAYNDSLMAKYRTEVRGARGGDGQGQRTPESQTPCAATPVPSTIPIPHRVSAAFPTPAASLPAAVPPAGRIRATPRARRLAQENNLDLAAIQAATGVEVVDETAVQKFLSKG